MAPFLAYCKARHERDTRDYALNIYVAENIRLIGCGKSSTKTWDEFWDEISGSKTTTQETYNSVLEHLKQQGLEVEQ